MTPAPARQPPSSFPTSSSNTTSTASLPPKSRLPLYLAGGLILLIVITVTSLKILPKLLQPKALNNQEDVNSDTNISNWKTYIKSKPNFSFKYPGDTQVTERSTTAETIIKVTHEKYALAVTLTAQTPEVDIENIAKQKHEQVFADCRNINKEFDGTPIDDDELTFPKITAKQFSVGYCPTYRFIYLFFHDGSLFTIERSFSLVYNDPANPENIYNLGIFDTVTSQILSTFKFTN